MELPILNQSPVVFDEVAHTYKLGDKYLKGITGTLVRRAYPNTYKTPEGMSEEVWQMKLAFAAKNGTDVHKAIQDYEDNGIESDFPELRNYKKAIFENGLIHLASEYTVSDEEHYASNIDHVYCTEEGQIVLVDYKHTSEIHWDDVTCQLSIYKKFFEMQNPHLEVSAIAVLWLRGEEAVFKVLKPLAEEVIDELIAADIKDEKFDIQQHFGDLPVKFAEVEDQIAYLEQAIKENKKKYDEMKAGLLALLEKYGVKRFTGNKVGLTYVAPTTRESFDTKKFAAEHPDLYEQYKTETNVKSSIKITIKKAV